MLILTRESALSYLGEVTIAPITSRVHEIPSEVVLSKSDGMPKECAVNLDHVQTVSKAKLGALLTRLNAGQMAQVRQALLFALGF